MRMILPLGLALSLAACAGVQRGGRRAGSVFIEQTNFPTRDAVEKLAAAPVPAKLADERGKDVPTWELGGPLPDAVERAPVQDDTLWGRMLSRAAAPRGESVVLTEAMRCVAREEAAFALANGGMTGEMLTRFIAARCGAPTGAVATSMQMVTTDPQSTDEKVFSELGAKFQTMVDKSVSVGRLEAGIGWARKGGKAVLALTMVAQTVKIDRTPMVPGPDGKVVIRGEVLTAAASVRGLINQGRYGFAACTSDLAVRLPRFAITCPASREDEVAWLSVTAQPPGRVLGLPSLEMMVWPSGKLDKTYARVARPGGPAAASSPEALLAEINQVRAEAKLPPLRLAEQESRTAARLAPHYFNAAESAGELPDQVALGLLAGWEVEGTVRNGHFISTWVSDAVSAADLVRSAISRPIGRQALLDPAVERLAVGPVAGGAGQGALFSTYALFDSYRHDRDATMVVATIAATRAARSAAPPKRYAELDVLAQRAAQSVQAGQKGPSEALDDLLQTAVDSTGRGVRGWVLETTSLDAMKLPEELVTQPGLSFGVGVAHHRPAGQAWGRFVVLVVMLAEGETGQTASLGAPPRG